MPIPHKALSFVPAVPGTHGVAAVRGLLRRLMFPELGAATAAGWAWRHRGTVMRAADLVVRSPSMLRDGGSRRAGHRGACGAGLDGPLPKATKVRISGIDAGTVTVHGDPGAKAVAAVRAALRDLPGVSDVRTDGATLPTAATLLQAAPTRS